jgi:hypothetical protein
MQNLWMIKTRCHVQPESELPQDGSDFYYGRSVSPAQTQAQAIEQLREYLAANQIFVQDVLDVQLVDPKQLPTDDDFDICESIQESTTTGEIALGCFLSESTMKREQ